jgi:hypothetical protein
MKPEKCDLCRFVRERIDLLSNPERRQYICVKAHHKGEAWRAITAFAVGYRDALAPPEWCPREVPA